MHVMEPVDLWQRYIDLAILFPTSAMYVTASARRDPRFAAATCRAYNEACRAVTNSA
jgi:hypothetical protein